MINTRISRLFYVALFVAMSLIVSVSAVVAVGMIADQVSKGIAYRTIGGHFDAVVMVGAVAIGAIALVVAGLRHKFPPAPTATFVAYQRTTAGVLLALLFLTFVLFVIGFGWGYTNYHHAR